MKLVFCFAAAAFLLASCMAQYRLAISMHRSVAPTVNHILGLAIRRKSLATSVGDVTWMLPRQNQPKRASRSCCSFKKSLAEELARILATVRCHSH